MKNGQIGDQLIALVKLAMGQHVLLVFLFHGVDGKHALNVSLDAHLQLLNFLKQNQKTIWTAPMIDVGEYTKKYQLRNKTLTFMKRKSPALLISVIALIFTNCSPGIKMQSINSIKGLKDYYKNYFPIGVAVTPNNFKTDEVNLILQQFNSLTSENAMKMEPIHPEENRYFWRDADSIVAFAQKNNLHVRGHNLCWHNQVPQWMFVDNGKTVSKAILLQRLKDHITTVVNRYKGKVYEWDVVNEAIPDNPKEYLRNSQWLQICGEEYIAKAFQYTHAADPDAILFYNDYNEISAVKREKIYRLVKSLIDAGVPIGGVGLQGHWAVNEPSREQLDSTINKFADLGLKIKITELDISVYSKEHDARVRGPEDANTAFTPEKEKQQLEVYKMCLTIFRKYKNVLTGVTFWNISDKNSWLDNFPVKNRKDYPLLFDKNLKPKKVFWEVVKF